MIDNNAPVKHDLYVITDTDEQWVATVPTKAAADSYGKALVRAVLIPGERIDVRVAPGRIADEEAVARVSDMRERAVREARAQLYIALPDSVLARDLAAEITPAIRALPLAADGPANTSWLSEEQIIERLTSFSSAAIGRIVAAGEKTMRERFEDGVSE